MFHHPSIISDTRTAHQSDKQVMDGIVKSAYMSGFQRQAIQEGIVKSAEPTGKKGTGPKEMMSAKGTATPYRDGTVHFPGSSMR